LEYLILDVLLYLYFYSYEYILFNMNKNEFILKYRVTH
jgi:hypothetical protein